MNASSWAITFIDAISAWRYGCMQADTCQRWNFHASDGNFVDKSIAFSRCSRSLWHAYITLYFIDADYHASPAAAFRASSSCEKPVTKNVFCTVMSIDTGTHQLRLAISLGSHYHSQVTSPHKAVYALPPCYWLRRLMMISPPYIWVCAGRHSI